MNRRSFFSLMLAPLALPVAKLLPDLTRGKRSHWLVAPDYDLLDRYYLYMPRMHGKKYLYEMSKMYRRGTVLDPNESYLKYYSSIDP